VQHLLQFVGAEFRSNTTGWITCFRLKASNCRVSAAALRPALAISSMPVGVESGGRLICTNRCSGDDSKSVIEIMRYTAAN